VVMAVTEYASRKARLNMPALARRYGPDQRESGGRDLRSRADPGSGLPMLPPLLCAQRIIVG
jgi:hypothetical protein